MARPFYTEYAWAFDLLVDRPVQKECGVIAEWLVDRQVFPGAELLDAGCGTGRYAIELARRGYLVYGIDLSQDLIDVAIRSAETSAGRVSFAVGNIGDALPGRYDGILCRGVLNDIVDTTSATRCLGPLPGPFGRAARSFSTSARGARPWNGRHASRCSASACAPIAAS